LSAPFDLTVGVASDATTKALPNIVITGLSVIPSVYDATRSKQLKVKSTTDVNEVGINITGTPP
jgi:hypothetical protein